jgi:copper chaperone CopZ
MRQITMAIAGMSCDACVTAVAKALSAVPGVSVRAVTVGSATVTYDSTRTTPAVIAEAIRAAGYRPTGPGAPVAVAVPVTGGCCGTGSKRLLRLIAA